MWSQHSFFEKENIITLGQNTVKRVKIDLVLDEKSNEINTESVNVKYT